MTRGSKWELDVYTQLRKRGYDVVHAMAQYQEQLCDIQVAGNDGKSIYIECKSTKGNKVSLNRNKHVAGQYLRFCELSGRHEHRAFYAVRFFEGDPAAECERYYQMPLLRNDDPAAKRGERILRPSFGLVSMPFGLDGAFIGERSLTELQRSSPINPPICPPVTDPMREPEDRTL